MNRRDFIVKLPALFALPLIIQQIGCDNSTSPTSSDNGTEDTDFSVTSSVDGGHSHTIKILYDDIDNPPASDKTLTSSSTNHTHQITITATNYQTLKDGGTVTKTSTTDGGHSHTFSIKVSTTNSTGN
jgi:hypothetical protein